MARCELEFLGKRHDLVVDELMPAGGFIARHAHALHRADNPMGNAHDHARHEGDGEDTQQDAHVAAEAEDAQQGDVAVLSGKERHAREQKDGTPGDKAKLIDDETRELNGARLAHVLPRLREAVDLCRGGPHHHGRQVTEEDAARLNRDKVTDTDRRCRIEPNGDGIRSDAEDEVQQHAQARKGKPSALDRAHSLPELGDLPGYNEIHDIEDEHEADEDRAAARSLVVIATGGLCGNFRLLRKLMRRIRHGSTSARKRPSYERHGNVKYILIVRLFGGMPKSASPSGIIPDESGAKP